MQKKELLEVSEYTEEQEEELICNFIKTVLQCLDKQIKELEEPEDIMDTAGDFLSKLNNNKEINLAIKNLNKLIKTKYNELLKSPGFKDNKGNIIDMVDNLLSDQEAEDNTIVDNAILNNFK